MPLREDLESTRDRALLALAEAHDYFTYTKEAWRTLQAAVARNGFTFELFNAVTDTKITEVDFVARAQRYVARELTSATLQQFVSIFENFLHDVLRLWLLAYPESLSGRQLSGREILRLADKNAILDALVEKELRDIFYDRPANWFKYLNERVNLPTADRPGELEFAEVKATRDVLAHGQGIANAYYVDKSGERARARVGQRLDVPEPYHQTSWELIFNLVNHIGDALAAKATGAPSYT